MKPVAWRNLCVNNIGEDSEWIYNEIGQGEPLYTAPRELSDEEIMDICIMGSFYDRISDPYFDKKTGAWSLDEDLVQFARAILKKASER